MAIARGVVQPVAKSVVNFLSFDIPLGVTLYTDFASGIYIIDPA